MEVAGPLFGARIQAGLFDVMSSSFYNDNINHVLGQAELAKEKDLNRV